MDIRIARNVGLVGFLFSIGIVAAMPGQSQAQLLRRWFEPCVPCPTAPSTGTAGATAPSGSGAQAGEATETPSNAAPSNLLASSDAGAAAGPESIAPFMVGDYLGGFVTMQPNGQLPVQQIPLPGGAIPRFKMAEDTSPMPVDRVYFNYDYYSNVQLTSQPSSVNAFTPGFEKTFLGGAMSVEVRLPMATTLSNTFYLDGSSSTGQGEIGNLGITVKALLWHSDTLAVSGGLGIDCPTAGDSECFANQSSFSSGIQMLNQSVHLLPFVGAIWTPTDRLFVMGFTQFDVDTNGETVNNITVDSSVSTITSAGRYYEQTMLYLDGVAGYWIRRDEGSERLLSGIALFTELHGNQSMNTSSGLSTVIGNMSGGNISILDMTVGADFQFGPLTTVTTAFCTPLTSQREFDGQFRLMLNRRF